MDDGNSVTTKLLTLLNVSATKIGKRKRTYEDHFIPSDKLNKRKSASFAIDVVQPERVEDENKEGELDEDVIMGSETKKVEGETEGTEDEESEGMS